jgi:hypothetical protein
MHRLGRAHPALIAATVACIVVLGTLLVRGSASDESSPSASTRDGASTESSEFSTGAVRGAEPFFDSTSSFAQSVPVSPSFVACMEMLARFELFQDVPEAVGLLTNLRPVGQGSSIDGDFAALIAAPTSEGVSRFMDSCRDEYVARQYEKAGVRSTAIPRPQSDESLRQIYLRMAIAVEYARASGALDAGESDKALWELSTKTRYDDQLERGNLFGAMVDRRLEETRLDEARWAAMSPVDVVDDRSNDSRSRHWVRAMIENRMEDAAAAGNSAAFEAYAERLLAIPHGSESREVLTRYYQNVVTKARQTLEAAMTGQ